MIAFHRSGQHRRRCCDGDRQRPDRTGWWILLVLADFALNQIERHFEGHEPQSRFWAKIEELNELYIDVTKTAVVAYLELPFKFSNATLSPQNLTRDSSNLPRTVGNFVLVFIAIPPNFVPTYCMPALYLVRMVENRQRCVARFELCLSLV